MKTKRIFISDIHIGLDNEWSWFNSKDNIARLTTFLDFVKAGKDEIKDLVIGVRRYLEQFEPVQHYSQDHAAQQ